MAALTPSEVLQAFQIPCHPNWYTIGYGESRVTLFTQQVRGLNLAWALSELGLSSNDSVIVIGGGAAGLSVAAGIAKRGASVTVLEKERHLVPLQRNCHKRHLHPHIFDWPDRAADNTRADLPLLDWQAASARDVALSLEEAFEELVREFRGKLAYYCQATDIGIDSPSVGHVRVRIGGPTARRTHLKYTKLIFAIGFGVENPFWGGRRGSYWADDALEQHGVTPPGRYLVSGSGDGGLIDIFRAMLPEVSQQSLVRLIRSGIPKEDAFLDWIREVDELARLAGQVASNAGDPKRVTELQNHSLWQSYEAFGQKDFGECTIDEQLESNLQLNVHVTLLTRSACPFTLATRPLHRFIFSRLCFRFRDRIDLRTSFSLTPEMLVPRGTQVALCEGGHEQLFEHAIVRHGPDRASCYAAFPFLTSALDGWTPRSIGEKKRFPRDYFGSPRAAYRGAVGPSKQDYLDELWGRGYLTDTVNDRIPLDEFSRIAVELRRVVEDGRVTSDEQGDFDSRSASLDDDPTDGDAETLRREDEEKIAPGIPNHKAQAEKEAAALSNSRWGISIIGVALTPGDPHLNFSCPTFIQGHAGTGKSTLIQQLVHRAIQDLRADDTGAFPILVKVQPDLDYWGTDVEAAIADAALRTIEMPGFSRAESELRRVLKRQQSGHARVFLDGVESWRPEVFRQVVRQLVDHHHEVVCCARRMPVTPALLGLEREPNQYELVGLSPASRLDFLCKQLGDTTLTTSDIPDNALVKKVPFLLLEYERARRRLGTKPEGVLGIYESRIADFLVDADEKVAAIELAKRTLQRTPPRFHFPVSAVPASLRDRLRDTPLFTGSRTVEFSHLTYGEFLASRDLSDEALAAARGKLREEGDTWHHQLEILAMAHASSAHQMELCLGEVQLDNPSQRQLVLLLRALAYGGPEVVQFVEANARRLAQALYGALTRPSGRFGQQERELVRVALATTPTLPILRLRRDSDTAVHGDASAAIWALELRKELKPSTRPPDSGWWDIIFAEARALVGADYSIADVVDLTEGSQSAVEQYAAISALGERDAVLSLLRSTDEFSRRTSVRNASSHELPHYLALLSDSDDWFRGHAPHLVPETVRVEPAFQSVLRAIAAKDPSENAKGAAVEALSREQGDGDENALLEQFRSMLRFRPTISSGTHRLFGDLLRRYHQSEAVQTDLDRFVENGWGWFCTEEEHRLLLKPPNRQALQLARLQSPSVTYRDIEAAGVADGLHDELRDIFRRLVAEASNPSLVLACLRALPPDDHGVHDTRIACLRFNAQPASDTVTRTSLQVRGAAARALAEHPEAEKLLGPPLLEADPSPSIFAALSVEAFQKTPTAAEAAKRVLSLTQVQSPDKVDWRDWGEVLKWAIETLGRHPEERSLLLNLLRQPPPPGKHEHLWGYRRADALRALSWGTDELVPYVDDPNEEVREAAVRFLIAKNKPSSAEEAALKRRAMLERAYDVQRVLWAHCSADPEVREMLRRKSRTDLWTLRRAFFIELSGDEGRVESLRDFLEAAMSDRERPAILRDLVEPLARDPKARPQLRRLLDRDLHTTALTMRVLADDASFRSEARAHLKRKDWVRQFLLTDVLTRFFSKDWEAKQFLYGQLQAGTLELRTQNAVQLLADYEPARDWVVAQAQQSDDPNARREALEALCDHEKVRPLIEADLALDAEDRANIAAILNAARVARNASWAWPRIAELHDSSDKDLRLAAVDASLNLRRTPAILLASDGSMITRLHDHEPEPKVRLKVIECLPQLSLWSDDLEPLLRATALYDYDYDVRNAANRQLRRAEPAQALRSLSEAPEGVPQGPTFDHLPTDAVSWLERKLVSSLGDDLDWTEARRYVDPVAALYGERILTEDGVILTRIAMDATDLPRERRIYPVANVVLAWLTAFHLAAIKPTTFLIACADLHSDVLLERRPSLRPGEVILGPVFFGFRLHDVTARGHEPNDPNPEANPS